jgi:hypothetical protein
MRSLCLLAMLLSAPGLAAAGSAPASGLADAAAARSLLGGDIWSRLVRIDNANPRGLLSRSPYPRTVYALVFELSGILWFYTDADGTQSLSLTRGTAARDEADPGPLFRAIDGGFTSWAWVDAGASPRAAASRRPPNACFVESVAALLRRLAVGNEASSPRLMSYYVDTPFGRLGHTVLVFGTASGLAAIDPEASGRPESLPPELGSDPGALSAYLRGGPVAAARTIPIACPTSSPSPGQWAALPSQPAPAG